MAGTHYKAVVVGAGVEGSWTALQLARKLSPSGGRVLLVDQFPLPHSRGSSHGGSRIIRHAYPEKHHSHMMPRCFAEWRLLEKETGKSILLPFPLLFVGNDANSYAAIQIMLDSLRDVLPGGETGPNPLYQNLSSQQLKAMFPMANFTDQHRGVYELCAGILKADKCLDVLHQQFVKLGGEIRDSVKVLSLRDDGSQAILNVESSGPLGQRYQITADKVAVCAGPWTSKLIDPLLSAKLPLTPLHVNVYYWRIKKDGPGMIKASYLDLGEGAEYWGLPEFEYPGMVKFSSQPRKVDDAADPEDRDKYTLTSNKLRVIKYIQKRFPGLEDSPSLVESCMYTMTPDETSIIDVVPGHKNIFIACGFSGTGFKKAPEVGRMMLQLMFPSGQQDIDYKPFALARFNIKPSSHL